MEGIEVIVENIDLENQNILVDFVDEHSFSKFKDKTNFLSIEEDHPSMLLLKNYNFLVNIDEIFYLNEDALKDIKTYQGSYIIGFELDCRIVNNITILSNINKNETDTEERVILDDFDSKHKYSFQQSDKHDYNVTVLNVGQANWNELYHCNKVVIVYDVGLPLKEKKQKVDKIVSEVSKRYIEDKPMLIISHWHVDHYQALKSWIKKKSVPFSSVIYIDYHPNITVKNIIKELQCYNTVSLIKYSIGFATIKPTLNYEEITENIKIFRPSHIVKNNRNISGIVLSLETEKGSVLFTGDISYEQLSQDVLPKIKCNINHNVIVPHHGGIEHSDNFPKHWGNNLECNTAIISYGENSYNHPNEKVLKNFLNYGFQICGTYRPNKKLNTINKPTLIAKGVGFNLECNPKNINGIYRIHPKYENAGIRLAL